MKKKLPFWSPCWGYICRCFLGLVWLTVNPVQAQQPVLVKDLISGPQGAEPSNLRVYNGQLYFNIHTGPFQYPLYVSDGTDEGTKLVANPDTIPHKGRSYIDYQGVRLFAGYDSLHGYELWISRGGQTKLLKDISPGTISSNPKLFTLYNDLVYFIAPNQHSSDLWVTDGTEAGTRPIPLNDLSLVLTSDLIVYKEKLYFPASPTSNTNIELYVSDGTPGGTELFKEIAPGQTPSYPESFRLLHDKLYFRTHYGLWVTDGTEAGTQPIQQKDASSAFELIRYQDKLYFSGADAVRGIELWVSDGTTTGTRLLKDIFKGPSLTDPYGGPGSANPQNFTLHRRKIYFTANDGNNTQQLWVTDGTEAGTQQVFTASPGRGPTDLVSFRDTLFFFLNEPETGSELYRLDETNPSSKTLTLIEPTYNCQTGDLRLHTHGGNNSPIEYRVEGLREWAADSIFSIPSAQRINQYFKLEARQNGQVTNRYFLSRCYGSQSLVLHEPYLNCSTGVLLVTYGGGNGGDSIQFRIQNQAEWTTGRQFTLPKEQRSGTAFTIEARQDGYQISRAFTSACPKPPIPTESVWQVRLLNNPVATSIPLEIKGAVSTSSIGIAIYDLLGRQLYQNKEPLTQTNQVILIPFATARPGMYLLQVQHMDQSKQLRILKN